MYIYWLWLDYSFSVWNRLLVKSVEEWHCSRQPPAAKIGPISLLQIGQDRLEKSISQDWTMPVVMNTLSFFGVPLKTHQMVLTIKCIYSKLIEQSAIIWMRLLTKMWRFYMSTYHQSNFKQVLLWIERNVLI